MMRIFLVLLGAVIFGVPTPCQANQDALVPPTAVAGMVNAVKLDLRPAKDYARGHLSGAISVPFGVFPWRVSRFGRPALLPFADDLAARLGKMGITRNSPLVLIDDRLGVAALVYWTLKSLGHSSLHILDGGQKAWMDTDRPVTTISPPHRQAQHYVPLPSNSAVADEDFVVNLKDNALVPLDCRTEIYWGGEKGGPAQDDFGSIEDSLNMSSEWIIRHDTGWFRPLKDISALYKRKMHSMLPDFLKERAMKMPTVFFGYDGKQAAICWFAVHVLLGNENARIYDGGIVDWEKNGHTIWNLQDGMGAR
jgi:thiosulfate/3-mercaptopyruvate sulfurtransferase